MAFQFEDEEECAQFWADETRDMDVEDEEEEEEAE